MRMCVISVCRSVFCVFSGLSIERFVRLFLPCFILMIIDHEKLDSLHYLVNRFGCRIPNFTYTRIRAFTSKSWYVLNFFVLVVSRPDMSVQKFELHTHVDLGLSFIFLGAKICWHTIISLMTFWPLRYIKPLKCLKCDDDWWHESVEGNFCTSQCDLNVVHDD